MDDLMVISKPSFDKSLRPHEACPYASVNVDIISLGNSLSSVYVKLLHKQVPSYC